MLKVQRGWGRGSKSNQGKVAAVGAVRAVRCPVERSGVEVNTYACLRVEVDTPRLSGSTFGLLPHEPVNPAPACE